MIYRQCSLILISAGVLALGVASEQAHAWDLDADVWLVDKNGGSDSNSGQFDWDNAFATIQKALQEAGAEQEIWVANGTYTPSAPTDLNDPDILPGRSQSECDDGSDRLWTFRLIKNVGLRGGFQGISHPSGGETEPEEADPANNITILSGDIGSSEGNAYHVIVYAQDTLSEPPIGDPDLPVPEFMFVDGFTIEDGVADGGFDGVNPDARCDGGDLNAIGGGALIAIPVEDAREEPSAPVFRRCVFRDNSAKYAGGAVACLAIGLRVEDCRFENNQQTGTTEIISPYGVQGGGAIAVVGPVAVLTSTFVDNVSVTGIGGGFHHGGFTGGTDPLALVSNCKFFANEALNGGGIGALDGTVVNSLFVGNEATEEEAGFGGGAIAVEIHGCTFVRNESEAPGGGASGGRVTHNIFWENTTTFDDYDPEDLWKAQVDMGAGASGERNDYNLIQDWECTSLVGAGCDPCCVPNNFSDNPDFMDDNGPDDDPDTFEDNDYHLDEHSPAINVGDTDIHNDADNGYFPRDFFDVDDDGIDGSGEYEITPEHDLADRVYEASDYPFIDLGAYEAPCFINSEVCGDCVNSATFAPPPDGIVDAADLAFLLGEWGSPAEDPNSCADKVTSATFAPPPDGNVDAADLAYLLGSWGYCCDFTGGGSPLMGGGGSGGGGGEESEGGASGVGPFEGTYLGLLLEELIATNDDDLAEEVAAYLQEMLGE